MEAMTSVGFQSSRLEVKITHLIWSSCQSGVIVIWNWLTYSLSPCTILAQIAMDFSRSYPSAGRWDLLIDLPSMTDGP